VYSEEVNSYALRAYYTRNAIDYICESLEEYEALVAKKKECKKIFEMLVGLMHR